MVARSEQRSIPRLAAELGRGELTSRELVESCLARIRALDARLNSFITVTEDAALAAAEAADRRLARGEGGPLTGIPIAHKDNLCTRGAPTTCASRMLAGFRSPYDATVVERLAAAGAVCLGKTNMDEFAMGSSGETSYFGATHNPWALERVPGGSSSGSAAAVAARLVAAATGTDTGGSVRQPAALCGVTGVKPTYGRVSRHGLVAFASSLDQAGVLAPSAEDAAFVLAAMAGGDARDATAAERDVPGYPQSLDRGIEGLRVGVAVGASAVDSHPDIAAALERAVAIYRELGARVVEIELPHAALAAPAYYVLAPAEAASNLARYDGVRYGYRCRDASDLNDLYERSRAEGFGAEVKRRILTGTYVLSAGYYEAYYRRAQQLRRLIADDFRNAFERADVILGPTAPEPAFALGERRADPVRMYGSDVHTVAASLAGLPAVSFPAGFAGGLPLGLQLVGPPFAESRLLRAAHRFQRVDASHRHLPPLVEEGA